MNDVRNILHAWENRGSHKAALATLVKTQGSSFRKPGARFLVRDDGVTAGSLSGGCVEHDVAEKALEVIGGKDSRLAVFDMTGTDDEIWGYGQGCNGILSILVEPLTRPNALQFDLIRAVSEERREGVIGTIIRVEGELKVQPGSHLYLGPRGTVQEFIFSPFITAAIAEEAKGSLGGASHVKEFRFTEGLVEVFFEIVRPSVSLIIAGAGSDAVPLYRLANDLGWNVTVLDHRKAMLTTDRFPAADVHLIRNDQDIRGKIQADRRSAVVIMTHNFLQDITLLPAFLGLDIPYVGLLGPMKRCETLLKRLEGTGFSLTPKQRSRLFAPVGLNLGAESPEEIALAILAEIQAVLCGRPAGHLRDGRGPIHTF